MNFKVAKGTNTHHNNVFRDGRWYSFGDMLWTTASEIIRVVHFNTISGRFFLNKNSRNCKKRIAEVYMCNK